MAVVGALWVGWLARPGWVSNDGAQYISVAEHLIGGRGIATDILYYDEHYIVGTMPAAQTVFPPGFPASIAVFRWLGAEPISAALIACLVAYALGAWLLCDLSLLLGQRPEVALALVAVWLGFVAHWIDVFLVHSEPAFVLFTLLAARGLLTEAHPARAAALAGLAAAAAFSVRYAGLFFLMAVALTMAAELYRKRDRTTLGRALAFGIAPAATVAALFYRNHLLVGDFKGGNNLPEHRTLMQALVTCAKGWLELAGLTKRGLLALSFAEVSAVVAAIALPAVVIALRREIHWARPTDARARLFAWLSGSYIGITTLMLLRLEMTTSIGFQARMFLPVVPFALLWLGQISSALRYDAERARWAVLAALGLVCLGYGGGQAAHFRAFASDPALRDRVSTALAPQLDMLRAETSAEHPLLGNEPQLLGSVVGRPVIGLTSEEYTATRWSADRVEALVRRYDTRLVVVMPELVGDEASEITPFFSELGRGEVPPWLRLELATPTLRIYRVEDDAGAGH